MMHMEPLHKMAKDLQPAFDRPVAPAAQVGTLSLPSYKVSWCIVHLHVPKPPVQSVHPCNTTTFASNGWAGSTLISVLCMQDPATLRELDDIVRTPDRLPQYIEDRKVDTAFRLWELDQHGKVKRKTIVRSLLT
jgi:hypothetical protein